MSLAYYINMLPASIRSIYFSFKMMVHLKTQSLESSAVLWDNKIERSTFNSL